MLVVGADVLLFVLSMIASISLSKSSPFEARLDAIWMRSSDDGGGKLPTESINWKGNRESNDEERHIKKTTTTRRRQNVPKFWRKSTGGDPNTGSHNVVGN